LVEDAASGVGLVGARLGGELRFDIGAPERPLVIAVHTAHPATVMVWPSWPTRSCPTGATVGHSDETVIVVGSVLAPHTTMATRSPGSGTYAPLSSAATAVAAPCSHAMR